MAERDELREIPPAEQEALKTLATRLLRADESSATAAMSRITLLWLDWTDRWQGHASEPMACEADPVERLAVAGEDRFRGTSAASSVTMHSREVESALELLRTSPRRFAVFEFLLDLARTNGFTETERQFLSYVRTQLEQAGRTGPYR